MEYVTMNGKSKLYYIMTDADFAEFLSENVSDSASEYFTESIQGERADLIANFRINPLQYCSGECDRVFAVQEACNNQMQEAEEIARELYAMMIKESRPKQKYIQKVIDIINVLKNR